uniref:protein transport protein SEC31-like n=1 Tax=Halichoerus grypus TaxID=9711 RepID=UPI001659038F|nr:protein transport protein SEC31-like [Halichoerus grypus]XP_035955592.1 protein transport protein SEC31-like [Halichoerus grypus]
MESVTRRLPAPDGAPCPTAPPLPVCFPPSPDLLTLPPPSPRSGWAAAMGQKKGGVPPMASSLCPLHSGLLGGRPNELSSYRPPPHPKPFHLSIPDNKATEARRRPLPPAPAELGFSVSFYVSLSPAPAQGCWPQAACPGVLKAQLPLSAKPRQAQQANGRHTGASREGGDAHKPPVARVKGRSSRSTTPPEAGSVHWTTHSGLILCWSPICPHPPHQDMFRVSVHLHAQASIHSPSWEPGAGCWPKEMPTRATLVRVQSTPSHPKAFSNLEKPTLRQACSASNQAFSWGLHHPGRLQLPQVACFLRQEKGFGPQAPERGKGGGRVLFNTHGLCSSLILLGRAQS